MVFIFLRNAQSSNRDFLRFESVHLPWLVWGFTPSLPFWKLLSLSYLTLFSKFFDKEFPDAGHILVHSTLGSWDFGASGFLATFHLPPLSQPWLANLRLPLLS